MEIYKIILSHQYSRAHKTMEQALSRNKDALKSQKYNKLSGY